MEVISLLSKTYRVRSTYIDVIADLDESTNWFPLCILPETVPFPSLRGWLVAPDHVRLSFWSRIPAVWSRLLDFVCVTGRLGRAVGALIDSSREASCSGD